MRAVELRKGRLVLQLQFGGSERHPLAASTRRAGSGARVTVEAEPEALARRQVFVLHRRGSEVVIAASAYAPPMEEALRKLGTAGALYRIACIPVVDTAEASAG